MIPGPKSASARHACMSGRMALRPKQKREKKQLSLHGRRSCDFRVFVSIARAACGAAMRWNHDEARAEKCSRPPCLHERTGDLEAQTKTRKKAVEPAWQAKLRFSSFCQHRASRLRRSDALESLRSLEPKSAAARHACMSGRMTLRPALYYNGTSRPSACNLHSGGYYDIQGITR